MKKQATTKTRKRKPVDPEKIDYVARQFVRLGINPSRISSALRKLYAEADRQIQNIFLTQIVPENAQEIRDYIYDLNGDMYALLCLANVQSYTPAEMRRLRKAMREERARLDAIDKWVHQKLLDDDDGCDSVPVPQLQINTRPQLRVIN